jgi:choline transport protein
MWLTMVIGIVTVIPWTLAFMFSTTDLTAVANSGLPILTVYYQALNNQAGAVFFTCWLLFVYFGALISCVATSRRLAWPFARDNGLPFSTIFRKVHSTLQVPANATLACAGFCLVYGLIYIAPTTAFNSFISMSIPSLNVTYAIPQAVALVRGRSKVFPKRNFDLGP